MDYSVKELKKFSDERGFLVEFLKNSELGGEMKTFGQIYLSTIGPGFLRGNHFHRRKHEFFALMSGQARLVVEDIETKKRKEHALDATGDHIVRIRVGPGVAHVIKNVSSETVVVCSYTDKEYDPEDLDQEAYRII